MSRTRRRPYTGSRRFDRSCRNHGSCPYCANGRQHASKRRTPPVEYPEGLMTVRHGVAWIT